MKRILILPMVLVVVVFTTSCGQDPVIYPKEHCIDQCMQHYIRNYASVDHEQISVELFGVTEAFCNRLYWTQDCVMDVDGYGFREHGYGFREQSRD